MIRKWFCWQPTIMCACEVLNFFYINPSCLACFCQVSADQIIRACLELWRSARIYDSSVLEAVLPRRQWSQLAGKEKSWEETRSIEGGSDTDTVWFNCVLVTCQTLDPIHNNTHTAWYMSSTQWIPYIHFVVHAIHTGTYTREILALLQNSRFLFLRFWLQTYVTFTFQKCSTLIFSVLSYPPTFFLPTLNNRGWRFHSGNGNGQKWLMCSMQCPLQNKERPQNAHVSASWKEVS